MTTTYDSTLEKMAKEIASTAREQVIDEMIAVLTAMKKGRAAAQAQARTPVGKAVEREGSSAAVVRAFVAQNPGKIGQEIVDGIRALHPEIPEPTIRGALHRMDGKKLLNRNGKWSVKEQA